MVADVAIVGVVGAPAACVRGANGVVGEAIMPRLSKLSVLKAHCGTS